MDSRIQGVLELALQLSERASQGPLSDEKRVVQNLRYIREELEKMVRRYNTPRDAAQDEALRQTMLEAIKGLYAGLESLERGVLTQDEQSLNGARQLIQAAVTGLGGLEARIEDAQGVSENTL